jgi:hypothetical protein
VFCVSCGQTLPDDAKFCSKCGRPQQGDDSKGLQRTEYLEMEVTFAPVHYKTAGFFGGVDRVSSERGRTAVRKAIDAALQPHFDDGWQIEEPYDKNVRLDANANWASDHTTVKRAWVRLKRTVAA